MALIKIELSAPPVDGIDIKFKAPCDCTEITGLLVEYPDGSQEFTFRDCHGNNLAGIGNLFGAGAYVKAILDTQRGFAYLQNADTNAYQEKGRFFRNLLINSNFRNPVNQIGKTSYGNGNTIDRWYLSNNYGTLTIEDGCIKIIASSAGHAYFRQKVGKTLRGKFTVAATVKGSGGIFLAPQNKDGASTTSGISTTTLTDEWETAVYSYDSSSFTSDAVGIYIRVSSGSTVYIKDFALYEGEFTAETLPEYQPKDPGVELFECMRYYRRITNSLIASFVGHITGTTRVVFNTGFWPFRAVPTVTMSDDFKITIRLGTGGYSTIADTDGIKPESVVSVTGTGGVVSVYFEMGKSPGTNNLPVMINVASGYLELSADV